MNDSSGESTSSAQNSRDTTSCFLFIGNNSRCLIPKTSIDLADGSIPSLVGHYNIFYIAEKNK